MSDTTLLQRDLTDRIIGVYHRAHYELDESGSFQNESASFQDTSNSFQDESGSFQNESGPPYPAATSNPAAAKGHTSSRIQRSGDPAISGFSDPTIRGLGFADSGSAD